MVPFIILPSSPLPSCELDAGGDPTWFSIFPIPIGILLLEITALRHLYPGSLVLSPHCVLFLPFLTAPYSIQVQHLKGTKLGGLLGDSWLREHEQYKEYYSAFFLKESWGNLLALLSREGLILFSGGRATARDLVKKQLKAFNEAFDEMYKKKSNWVMLDKDLRDKTCQLIIQAIVPVYRSYMQNYGPLVEQEGSSKYVKYMAQSLEKMLNGLFHPKPVKHGSFKVRHPSGKFNNVITNQNQMPPPVKS
ncbi:hypothetical protein CQW23_33710 [Capsicum baccatum]|uniref:Exocyst subunit Exo70 family protein n=1 Tax=Capsicum baccatum TaxID=33114 RepID=A0A2G2V0Z5_CAPBA|nr:hypothetical protein CQW23_33710 [Capsicum baccatum]